MTDIIENSGESQNTAIVILGAKYPNDGIRAEFGFFQRKHGVAGEAWSLVQQSLDHGDDQQYDLMNIRLSDGTDIAIYSTITDFFEGYDDAVSDMLKQSWDQSGGLLPQPDRVVSRLLGGNLRLSSFALCYNSAP